MLDTTAQTDEASPQAQSPQARSARGLLTLPAGAVVLTMRGECAARDLAQGDRIITRDSGVAVLRAVTPADETFAAIRVTAGSLGHTRPGCDMQMPPRTLVHIRDWRAHALRRMPAADVAATDLVDGEFIAEESAGRHAVVTLAFDRDHIIYADGLELRAALV